MKAMEKLDNGSAWSEKKCRIHSSYQVPASLEENLQVVKCVWFRCFLCSGSGSSAQLKPVFGEPAISSLQNANARAGKKHRPQTRTCMQGKIIAEKNGENQSDQIC